MDVQEITDDINLALPFLDAVSRKTSTRADDLVVAILRVVINNKEIMDKVVETLQNDPAAQAMMRKSN